jgi:dolichol-phosphate mannosyltransferase
MIEAIYKSIIIDKDFEIIYVDDGSSDKTIERINQAAEDNPHLNIKLLEFTRNYGQTPAMAAGIEAATGKYIATIDGDLQNDPSDILMMIEKLEVENMDIIAGERKNRKDGMVLRKIPSKIANMLIRKITKVKISDYGCTLKIFRSDFAKDLDLYGELHRFIPILGSLHGAKIAEVPVKHHARLHGTSKYGIGRTFKVASDLLLMFFFVKYRQKPMHLFGILGMFSMLASGLIAAYLTIEKLLGNDIGNRPIFYVGILLVIVSMQFFTTGFIAELMMRTFHAAKNSKPYKIRNTYIKGQKQED